MHTTHKRTWSNFNCLCSIFNIRSAKAYLATPVHGHYEEILSEGNTLVIFICEKSNMVA